MRYVLLLAVLAACDGRRDLLVTSEAASDPAAPAWVRDPLLAERATTAADLLVQKWGGSSADLRGWEITITDACLAEAGNLCTTGETVTPSDVVYLYHAKEPCLELTALAHEIGHVVIGDSTHADSRWRDSTFWGDIGAALAGIVPAAEVDCRNNLLIPAGSAIAGHYTPES